MSKTNENKTPLTAEEFLENERIEDVLIHSMPNIFGNPAIGTCIPLSNLLNNFASQQLAEKDETIEAIQDVARDKTIERDKALKQIQSLKEEVERYKNLLLQRDNIIFNDEKSNRIKQLEEGISRHIKTLQSSDSLTEMIENINSLESLLSTNSEEGKEGEVELLEGDVLVATDSFFMNKTNERFLTRNMEYPIIKFNEKDLIITSDFYTIHYFSLDKTDPTYWGKFLKLKPRT